jgi:hypothetical protein
MTIKPPQGNGTRSILIAFIILVSMVLFASTAISAPDYVAGDVNGDGVIDVRDVVLVQKHILGLQFPPLTQVQLLAADVNGDGDINVSDAVTIMQITLGIIDSYPMPIVSLNDAVLRVPIYTALADINLPSTVEANFAGGLKRNIGVRWERVSTPAYNPFVFDEYIFRGDLINLPSGVRNPAGLRATARVSFLLRDPWPFPDDGYFLFIQVNPFGAGTVTGAGNYGAGATVTLSATPNPGYSFINWTRGGVVVSTSPSFTYTMPAANTTLVANFTDGPMPWNEELESPPVIGGGLLEVYIVTLTIKDQFRDDVTAVTVKGVSANQNPANLKEWRAVINSSVPLTLNDLRGQIVITRLSPPGAIDIIDLNNSSATLVNILGGDVSVRVKIKPGQTATSVTADGLPLTYNALADRWQRTLFGYGPGSIVTINASNLLGTQTEFLFVQEVN